MNAKQWIANQWAKEKKAAARIWFNFLGIWVSIDQSAGMILGFIMHPASNELWPDETLSARCGRLWHRYPYKFWRVVIDVLFFWQGPGHCVNAHKKERTLYHFPPSMRNEPDK